MSSSYERELREILGGNAEIIKRATKTCEDSQKAQYNKILNNPFITVRAAGSLGIADLVALRGDLAFIIEIKVRKGHTIMFSHEGGRMQRQAEEMQFHCNRTKTLPVYAFRIKGARGDSWRIFSMNNTILTGKSKQIYEKLPKLEESKNGNYIMRWDKGMKLGEFIELISN